MRELIERLEGLAEASSMDSLQFCDALEKKAKIGDRVLILDPFNQFSRSYDEVIGKFFNVTKDEIGGARGMNNRFLFSVSGFGKEKGTPPPGGKVKFETMVRFYPLGKEGKVRAKTATPEKIVDYVASVLEKFAKTEPNRNV